MIAVNTFMEKRRRFISLYYVRNVSFNSNLFDTNNSQQPRMDGNVFNLIKRISEMQQHLCLDGILNMSPVRSLTMGGIAFDSLLVLLQERMTIFRHLGTFSFREVLEPMDSIHM